MHDVHVSACILESICVHDEFATNSRNKNIRDLYRGINKFKKGYQPRSNLVKDENGDLLADTPQHFE
jgi:hypothetical protein